MHIPYTQTTVNTVVWIVQREKLNIQDLKLLSSFFFFG